jgi:hypothetical protein
MKRIAWLFLVVLGSVILTQAQSSANTMKMKGTVCNSTCVTKVDNLSTCDRDCTDRSGPAVLVEDNGQVNKIANQDICKSHMGKHVSAMAMRMDEPSAAAIPTEGQREQTLRIMELEDQAP